MPRRPQTATRIAAIVLGPAVAAAVVGPVLHEETRDRLVGITQLQRRDGRIHASRHANDGARASPCSIQVLQEFQRLASPGEEIRYGAPDQRTAVASRFGLQLARGQPDGAKDAFVQRAFGVVPYRLGRESEAQVVSSLVFIQRGRGFHW